MLYQPGNSNSNGIRLIVTGIILFSDIGFKRRGNFILGRCGLPCYLLLDSRGRDFIEDFLTERPGIQICYTYHLAQHLSFLSELEKASFSDKIHMIICCQIILLLLGDLRLHLPMRLPALLVVDIALPLYRDSSFRGIILKKRKSWTPHALIGTLLQDIFTLYHRNLLRPDGQRHTQT